jgi:hypothetical protein
LSLNTIENEMHHQMVSSVFDKYSYQIVELAINISTYLFWRISVERINFCGGTSWKFLAFPLKKEM